MADCVDAIEPGERTVELHVSCARELAEPRLVVMVSRPVQLAAVAGGEQQRGSAGRMLVREHARQLLDGERELLANADRGRMVAYANDME